MLSWAGHVKGYSKPRGLIRTLILLPDLRLYFLIYKNNKQTTFSHDTAQKPISMSPQFAIQLCGGVAWGGV